MIEIRRPQQPKRPATPFQNAMPDTFILAVQALSGRNVPAFISHHRVGADIEVERFFFTPHQPDRSGALSGAPACLSNEDHRVERQPVRCRSRNSSITVSAGLVLGTGELDQRNARSLARAVQHRVRTALTAPSASKG